VTDNYIHASLGGALDQKLSTGATDKTIISILLQHINGRVPVLAAGRIHTPEQAESALEIRLSVVAVGQVLVIDPDWGALVRTGHGSYIRRAISANDVVRTSILRNTACHFCSRTRSANINFALASSSNA
jgi:2,4-dienoyl-CoA reductase-like NADH-dependent reductase (Old Yellow Enzyme family)